MKKNLIKLFTFSLTLVSVLGILFLAPTQTKDIYAEELTYTADFGSLKYQILEDGTIEIIGLSLKDEFTEVVIPAVIDDKPVTSIGDKAFYNDYRMTQIELPDSLSYIGQDAFACTHNLKSIRIPSAVTTISAGAFSDSIRLETVEIPETVTYIGRYAFLRTPWLESKKKEDPFVVVNGMLIDGQAVTGDAVISDTVHTIIEAAFCGNTNLTGIKIPNTVTSIEKGVFDNCHNLINVELPDSITVIAENTFKDCYKLQDFVIPASVTTIENRAFSYCMNFQNIIIPDSVTSIGEAAFDGCSMLKSITLPNFLTKIEDSLLSCCYELSTIQIPKGVTTIENNAFYGDNSLKTVKYPGTKAEWSKIHISSIGNEYLISANKHFSDGDDTITEPKPPVDYTPKGTKLSKVTAKKKAFVLKWKKQSGEITGYEIQYSLKKNFSKAQIKKVKKNKTSLTVKKLKPKKKYYVRIRTYKTVNGQGTFYSEWSKAKNVKTKK